MQKPQVVCGPVLAADCGKSIRVLAKCLTRMGFSTKTAMSAAMMLKVIATPNTALQPLACEINGVTGTMSAPAPFAVYSIPAFEAAYFAPNVSPEVAGNKLKISP